MRCERERTYTREFRSVLFPFHPIRPSTTRIMATPSDPASIPISPPTSPDVALESKSPDVALESKAPEHDALVSQTLESNVPNSPAYEPDSPVYQPTSPTWAIPETPVSTTAANRKLFVGNLSPNASRTDLHDVFASTGRIDDVYNSGKGYGFVTFVKVDDATHAMRKTFTCDGQALTLQFARSAPRASLSNTQSHPQQPRYDSQPQSNDTSWDSDASWIQIVRLLVQDQEQKVRDAQRMAYLLRSQLQILEGRSGHVDMHGRNGRGRGSKRRRR